MPNYTTYTVIFTPVVGGPDVAMVQKFHGTKFIDKKMVEGDDAAIIAEKVRDIFGEEEASEKEETKDE